MRAFVVCAALLGWRLVFATSAGSQTMPQKQAISATVTGNDEKVGFRAMIMKQAIEYNLAGEANNLPNDIVKFTLQGDPAADRSGGRRHP